MAADLIGAHDAITDGIASVQAVDRFSPDWSYANGAAFGRRLTVSRNALANSGMFTDEALAALIDAYPAELHEISTAPCDAPKTEAEAVPASNPASLSGADVLENIKAGRLWLSLRGVMSRMAPYASLLERMFAELQGLNPGFKPHDITGDILIRPPGVATPFQIHRAETMLWQVRGQKRLWVYPIDGETLPDAVRETALSEQADARLPYDPRWDARAISVDLKPGRTAAWAAHHPYRALTFEGLSVSVSTEFSTWRTRVDNGALLTNGVLRRAWGRNPTLAADGPPMRLVKFAASPLLARLDVNRFRAKPGR